MASGRLLIRLLSVRSPHLHRSDLFCTFAVLGKLPGARPRVVYLISTSSIMSKQSLFWGNASGKLGETVFYRAGGEQRNRTYVKNIKNPKTLAQAEQRLAMLNFSAGFRLLAPVLRASFPNRPSNLSGFNAFVKANKNILTPVIDRTIADKGLAVLGQMVVSQGNLIVGNGFQLVRDAFTDPEEESAPPRDGIVTTISLSAADIAEGGSKKAAYDRLKALADTMGDVIVNTAAAVADLFTLMGLSQNAVITCITGSYDDDGYSYEVNRVVPTSASGTFNSTAGTLHLMAAGGEGWANGATEFLIGLSMGREESDSNYFAIIVSDKIDGKLDVTTSRLITPGSNTEYTQQFQKGGVVYEQIMANYGPSQGSVLEA